MAINPTGQNMPVSPIYQAGPGDVPTGGPGNYNFGNSTNPNPPGTGPILPGSTYSPLGVPTVSMNPAGTQAGGGGLGLSGGADYTEQSKDFGNELGKIYGKGEGSEIYNYLQRGGGYNGALTTQAITAQDEAMQREAMQGWGNISSTLGAQGISPNSSVNALAMSNYWSGVTTNENAIAAQEFYNMWNQSQDRELSVLQGTMGKSQEYEANKPGLMDYFSGGLQIGGDIFKAFAGGG